MRSRQPRGVVWGPAAVALCAGPALAQGLGNPPPPGMSALRAFDGRVSDQFGVASAVSGSWAVVGANLDDEASSVDSGINSGSAYVFERVGSAWSYSAKLRALDPNRDDRFGGAVAIDGQTMVIGATDDDERASNAGAAYVFEKTGSVWLQTAKLTASDAAASDFFGRAVAISGDAIAVGAADDDDRGSASGSVYIFERVGGVWAQVAKLAPADTSTSDRFGGAVAMDGAMLAVGTINHDVAPDPAVANRGAVFIFEKVGAAWLQTAKVRATGGAWGERLGSAVSLAGETLAATALEDSAGCPPGSTCRAGSVYVFERVGGAWTQRPKLLPWSGDARTGPAFGASIGVSGGRLLVGAPGSDKPVFGAGSVYIFRRVGAAWEFDERISAPPANTLDLLGWSVALDGPWGLIGAIGDDGAARDAGAVWSYDAADCPCDLDGDGTVGRTDASLLLIRWGTTMRGDFNGDGVIDATDVSRLLGGLGPVSVTGVRDVAAGRIGAGTIENFDAQAIDSPAV